MGKGRIRKAVESRRLRRKLSLSRQLGLRHLDRGQASTEHVGVIILVALIVVALLATGVGPTVADKFSSVVCSVTGGENCGGGNDQAGGGKDKGGGQGGDGKQASHGGGDGKDGDGKDGDENLSADEIAYNKSKSELDKALKKYNVTKKELKKAAEALIKIAGEETGVTDALKCITEGDGSACTQTVINALLMAAGGMPLKLAKKYLFNPKKGWKVGKSIVKNGSKVAKGLKGLYTQSKAVNKLKKKTAALKKKADAARKKRLACGSKHSFLPGTPVLLADGRRIPIEEVAVGERVLAGDPGTGRVTAREVTRTISTADDKQFTRLTVDTAHGPVAQTATDTHPFWSVELRRWVNAGDIQPGALLRTSAGTAVQVQAVEHFTQAQRTHDLTVAGVHTYFVGVGRDSVLVHNDNGCDLTKYRLNLKKRGANYGNPKQRAYQRKHLGETEYQVKGGGEKIWADGIDGKTGDLMDAKYVDNPAKSPFVEGSKAPDFIRKKVDKEIDDELRRYSAVTKDPASPHKKLRIVVNDQKAVKYFEDRMRKHGVNGSVEVRP